MGKQAVVLDHVADAAAQLVAKNIGLVPGMLGWSKERTAARVDELDRKSVV